MDTPKFRLVNDFLTRMDKRVHRGYQNALSRITIKDSHYEVRLKEADFPTFADGTDSPKVIEWEAGRPCRADKPLCREMAAYWQKVEKAAEEEAKWFLQELDELEPEKRHAPLKGTFAIGDNGRPYRNRNASRSAAMAGKQVARKRLTAKRISGFSQTASTTGKRSIVAKADFYTFQKRVVETAKRVKQQVETLQRWVQSNYDASLEKLAPFEYLIAIQANLEAIVNRIGGVNP